MYWYVHFSLAFDAFMFFFMPHIPSTSTNTMKNIVFLCIGLLSFCRVSFARKALINVAIVNGFIVAAHLYLHQYSVADSIGDFINDGIIMYFALSSRYDYLYSKWGVFGKKTTKQDPPVQVS